MDPDDAFLANVTSTMQQKVEELLGEESGLVEVILHHHWPVCKRMHAVDLVPNEDITKF